MKSHINLFVIVSISLTTLFLISLGGCRRYTEDDEVEPDIPASMVLIPAGEFQVQINQEGHATFPFPTVYVDAFYMDNLEVSVAQYAAFLNAKGNHQDEDIHWYNISDRSGTIKARILLVDGVYSAESGYENHPVQRVTWYGAMAYAAWKGKRLPTAAEWEKAARGGLVGQNYPWGNTLSPEKANYGDHIDDTTPVGKYPPNAYGLYDMVGNVTEWCLDAGAANARISSNQNPIYGEHSVKWLLDNYREVDSSRCIRGGSWSSFGDTLHLATIYVSRTGNGIGFRCVKSVSP